MRPPNHRPTTRSMRCTARSAARPRCRSWPGMRTAWPRRRMATAPRAARSRAPACPTRPWPPHAELTTSMRRRSRRTGPRCAHRQAVAVARRAAGPPAPRRPRVADVVLRPEPGGAPPAGLRLVRPETLLDFSPQDFQQMAGLAAYCCYTRATTPTCVTHDEALDARVLRLMVNDRGMASEPALPVVLPPQARSACACGSTGPRCSSPARRRGRVAQHRPGAAHRDALRRARHRVSRRQRRPGLRLHRQLHRPGLLKSLGGRPAVADFDHFRYREG